MLTWLVALDEMHAVLLPIATHLFTSIVVTVPGSVLVASEYKVVTLSWVVVPNSVAVGVGLHAMLSPAVCAIQTFPPSWKGGGGREKRRQ